MKYLYKKKQVVVLFFFGFFGFLVFWFFGFYSNLPILDFLDAALLRVDAAGFLVPLADNIAGFRVVDRVVIIL